MAGNATQKPMKKPDDKGGAFTRYANKDAAPAQSEPSALNRFSGWVREKMTPRPIQQIEDTLNSGKPPEKKK